MTRHLTELPKRWESPNAEKPGKTRQYEVHVALEDAARLKALADMFPNRSEEELINDLLDAALRDLPDPAGRS